MGLWKVWGCSRSLRRSEFRVLGNMGISWVGRIQSRKLRWDPAVRGAEQRLVVCYGYN